MEKETRSELSRTLDVLESLWHEGTIGRTGLPVESPEKARLERLLGLIIEAQTQALTLATGDLTSRTKSAGVLCDGLRKIQDNMDALFKRIRRIADGDFAQRIETNGELSFVFNEMIKNMEDNRHRLRRRDAELFDVNARLHQEIEERTKSQDKLEVANATLQSQILEIQSLQAKLREQAIRDSLTSLFNRRFLEETLDRELSAAARGRSLLTILLLDLDHFKEFNDQYGHEAGDTVLRVVGSLLRGNTRSSDIACRYGGEEFIVVLPGATLELGCERAEFLRVAFEQTEVMFNGKLLKATFSVGVSTYPTHGSTREELIRAADMALYGAKRSGRNRIVLAT